MRKKLLSISTNKLKSTMLFCFAVLLNVGLMYGQTEIAANGDFETGDDTGWLLFQNGGSAALDNTIANGGTWSGKLETSGPSNPAFKQEAIGIGVVAAESTVTVSFDHIGTAVQPGAVFNVLLFGEGATGASFTQALSPAPVLSGTWTSYSASYAIPAATDVSGGVSFLIQAVCGGDAGCSVSVNIDNVSVTVAGGTPATCSDGIQNQGETGVDCGGPNCAPCDVTGPTTVYPVYDGTFGNVSYQQTFNFPTAAEAWGGYANNNVNMYPLSFSNGGKITFKATVAADAEVYFRFEANPFPNVDPAYNTANVSLLAANGADFQYEVAIPANATNTYNSALFYVVTRDVDVSLSEIKILTYDTDGTTVLKTDFPSYDGTFGNVSYQQTFNFPTAAEAWGGFANNNVNIYSLSFPYGGKITFKATVAADAEVYFRFEANPFPNVDPAYNTANVSLLAANGADFQYEVAIPTNATNTYNSALFYVVTRDVDVSLKEIKIEQFEATAGLNDFKIAGLKAYPNPTQDSWTVKTKNIKMSSIQVFDILGKSVMSLQPETTETTIDASGLKSGLYFAKISTTNGSSSLKLVKQ